MSAVAVDEALRCSLGRLLRSVWTTQTDLATIVSLLNLRRGCVRVSVCVTLLGRLLLFLSAKCSNQYVLICITPKLQACMLISTLTACLYKKFAVPTVMDSAMRFRCFDPFQLCSIIIWTRKGHCVLNEKSTCQSPHFWLSSLKTGLVELHFNLIKKY